MAKAKGIFCIEDADWWGNLQRPSSAEPALTVLNKLPPYKIPYIHRDVDTRDEFNHCIQKWLQAGYSRYPILYLAFHGTESNIQFGNLKKAENQVGLDELEDMLSKKCNGRIIYFSTCDTLGVNGNRINAFIRRTGALAVCGYRHDVDWLESLVFDLLFFREAQRYSFTIHGMNAIKRRMRNQVGSFYDKLDFRMLIRKP
jgi:hypothetical protein